jgi:nucleotide-binding universal stress UspA family protein
MYKKVLVPLDGSKLAECVLPHLETIAGGCGVQTVVFFRVVRPFNPVTTYGAYLGEGAGAVNLMRINEEDFKAAEDYLRELVQRVKYRGVEAVWKVVKGNEAESIADYAKNNEVDLILIATHGRSGVSRWVLGSVADRVLRSACVPVLMIRATGCIPGI